MGRDWYRKRTKIISASDHRCRWKKKKEKQKQIIYCFNKFMSLTINIPFLKSWRWAKQPWWCLAKDVCLTERIQLRNEPRIARCSLSLKPFFSFPLKELCSHFRYGSTNKCHCGLLFYCCLPHIWQLAKTKKKTYLCSPIKISFS